MLKKAVLLLILAISLPATIIKKPPVKPVDLSYAELVCKEEDKALIHEIITTVAENSKLALLFKQNHLNELGARIEDVHPMKFLTTILHHPQLRVCLEQFWPDHFKRAGFLEGFATAMSRETDKGKLRKHIEPFAKDVNLTAEEITPYFDSRDWEGLVSYIIKA
jgi:hypothetical protein